MDVDKESLPEKNAPIDSPPGINNALVVPAVPQVDSSVSTESKSPVVIEV
jgi:hypothetical protein